MDEKLIDILWEVKEGKIHPTKAYKKITELIKNTKIKRSNDD